MYNENLLGFDLPVSSIGKSLASGYAHDIPVSLFEAYSGHVNMNDYRAFKDNSLRGSMRESRARDLRQASPKTSEAPTLVLGLQAGNPVFDRSVSLLEFTLQS